MEEGTGKGKKKWKTRLSLPSLSIYDAFLFSYVQNDAKSLLHLFRMAGCMDMNEGRGLGKKMF